MVVQEYISLGHERLLSPKEAAFQPEGISWWLPHYAVVNPNKPNKVRVVFDTAAKHAGTSLIDALLKGTDFLTSLVVVLTRFRLFKVAINADILKMFHSDRVPLSDASAFRFLRRRPGSSEPAKDYQMQEAVDASDITSRELKQDGFELASGVPHHGEQRTAGHQERPQHRQG